MKGADAIVRIGALLILAASFLPTSLWGLLDGKSAATPIVAAASFGGRRKNGGFTTFCTAWVAVVALGVIALSPVHGIDSPRLVPGIPPLLLSLAPSSGSPSWAG